MVYSIDRELYNIFKSHFECGDFNQVSATFYHKGCEILYNQITDNKYLSFTPSSDFNFIVYEYLLKEISSDCILSFRHNEDGVFAISLNLILNHTTEEPIDIEIEDIVDGEVIKWISVYLQEDVDLDQIYISLELNGESLKGDESITCDFKIHVDGSEEVEIFSKDIEASIQKIIIEKAYKMVKNMVGYESKDYDFSLEIDVDFNVSLIENCYCGDLTVK